MVRKTYDNDFLCTIPPVQTEIKDVTGHSNFVPWENRFYTNLADFAAIFKAF